MKYILYLLLFAGIVFGQSLVRVDYAGFAQMDDWTYDIVYIRGDAYIELVGWENDLERLEQSGIHYEIIIQDMPEYYRSRFTGTMDYGGYHKFSEIVAKLDSLHDEYPELVSEKISVSESREGNQLWAVKISDNVDIDEDEPEILYDFAIHAREVITFEVAIYYMEWLLDNYGANPLATYIVNERELWFIPVMNPDGVLKNEESNPDGGGMWRKNTRDNNENSVFDYDYDGVDMNRNFGYMWGTGGSSPDPASDTYMGPDSFSEPELQGFRDFVISREFITYMNFHSYSNLYLFPWGYTEEHCDDHSFFMLYTDWMSALNGYVNGNAYETIYQVSGGTFDWIYGVLGVFGISPEVGGEGDGFWPPEERIVPLCEENLLACIINALIADVAPRAYDVVVNEVSGDGDGYLDIGEQGEITVLVRNYGLESISDVSVLIRPITPGISIIESTYAIPGSISERGGTAVANNLVFFAMPPISPGDIVKIEIVAQAQERYYFPDTFSFTIGTPFAEFEDGLDAGYSEWTLSGEWEIGSPTSGPMSAYSSPNVLATLLSGDYSDDTHSEVTSPWYYVSSEILSPTLRFRHWYSAEHDGTPYDGGNVWIRDSESSWVLLEPVSGYPAILNPYHPTMPNEPAFSGRLTEWTEEVFSLSEYSGDSIKLKFVFGSDAYVHEAGWYIDDLSIGGYEPETSATAAEREIIPHKFLIKAFPNPFNSVCILRISNFEQANCELEILDISGRILQKFKLGLGENEIVLDADKMDSGIYFARISGVKPAIAKILLVR